MIRQNRANKHTRMMRVRVITFWKLPQAANSVRLAGCPRPTSHCATAQPVSAGLIWPKRRSANSMRNASGPTAKTPRSPRIKSPLSSAGFVNTGDWRATGSRRNYAVRGLRARSAAIARSESESRQLRGRGDSSESGPRFSAHVPASSKTENLLNLPALHPPGRD